MGKGSSILEVVMGAVAVVFGAAISCASLATFGDEDRDDGLMETRSSKEREEEEVGLETLMFISFRFCISRSLFFCSSLARRCCSWM